MIYLPMIYSVNTNQVSVISNIFCLNISTKLEVNLIPQVKVIVKKSTAGKIFNIDHTPCLSTPVGTTWLTGENVKFSKNFRGETHESVSVEEAKKPIGENIKIQQVELTNILRWFKNISTRLTKNTSGWATFKCQKSVKYFISYQRILRIENGVQYTKLQIHNAFKNQIYPKKPRCIYLDWLYNTTISLSPKPKSPLSYMKNEQIHKTSNISRCSVSLHILETKILNLGYNGAFKVLNHSLPMQLFPTNWKQQKSIGFSDVFMG